MVNLIVLTLFVYGIIIPLNIFGTFENDLNQSELVVGNFIEVFNKYSEDYSFARKKDLMDEFCLSGQTTSIDEDIPDIPSSEQQIQTYLRKLKEYKVKVKYENNFTIERCSSDYDSFLGAYVNKMVVDAKGAKFYYREFFELREINGITKIKSISSEKLRNINSLCASKAKFNQISQLNSNSKLPKEVSSSLESANLEKAEDFYKEKNYDKALIFYQNVKDQNLEKSNLIENKIDSIFLQEGFSDYIDEKISKDVESNNLQESIDLMKIASTNKVYLSNSSKPENINQRILELEKRKEFENIIEEAEYEYLASNFQKSLNLYKKALSLSINTFDVNKKILLVEEKIKLNSIKTIKENVIQATSWIESNNFSKLEDALILLMKYENNDVLEGKHYFYMAQILDQKTNKAKKTFDLSNNDCCVKTKLFFLKALNKGYKNKFTEYFWENHLNKRSRTCN